MPPPEGAAAGLVAFAIPVDATLPLAAAAPGDPDAAAEWALSVIDAVERTKAQLDALALGAWRTLHAAYRETTRGLLDVDSPGAPDAADRGERVAASATVSEVMAATGLGELACRRRLDLAHADPARVATVARLLCTAEIGLDTAIWLHEQTAALEAAAADEVARVVTRPGRDGSRSSTALRRRRMRRELARRCDPSTQRAQRLARRDVEAVVDADGTGTLWITGDGPRVTAALERVDVLARRVRASGRHGGRSLGQLRSGIALDLLLHGGPPTDATQPSTGSRGAGLDWVAIGELPPARVHVVVPLAVLLGGEGLAELPGHGWIGAAQAREVAHAPGSVWPRLLTDPATGALVELSGTRYRPPPRLAAHVVARDRHCRGPGCTVDAARADLDHDRPWPGGSTGADNLSAKHRRHHELKTVGVWTATRDGDDLVWTTLAGRTYRTEPHDYRELDPQAGVTDLERG
jgi:hypothetical protein